MNKHIEIDRDAMQAMPDITAKIISGLRGEQRWAGEQITRNGVYANVPIETYHRDTNLFDEFAISSSGLRQLIRRPLEYWFTSPYNPDADQAASKRELEFGKAAHMLLLGEDGFAERYVLRPDTYPDSKTGAAKPWSGNSTWCKTWLADQAKAGRTVITETEIEHIRAIAVALRSKEAIRLGIMNGRIERSIFLKDGDIWLKTRPDVIPNDGGDFVDLKTTASVDDESLSKSIFNNGYHVQAGLQRWIVREVLGADAFNSFTFVFVEKTAPYDVRIMTLKDSDIDLGERQARRGVEILRRCIAEGRWPGFDGFEQHISYVEMPSWARTRIDTQLHAEAA